MAEYRVAIDLMQRGYAVFRAMSPHCYCDLIASTPGHVWEIEVKLGRRRKNGRWSFSPTQYVTQHVLCVAIWERATDMVAYLNTRTMEPLEL